MNTKIKSLVVAVALAASGTAGAAIDPPNSSNGELFFNIWDATVGKEFSFTLGLNQNMNTFQTTGMSVGTINFGNIFSNSTYLSLLNDPADGGHDLSKLRWNVLAGSGTGSEDGRVMLTQMLASPASAYSNGQVEGGNTNIANFLSQTAFTTGNEGGTSAPASLLYAAGGYLGGDSVGGAYNSTTAGIGGNLGFYMFSNTQSFDPNELAIAQTFQAGGNYGTWNLSASGDLTYSLAGGAPAPVPVPAAAWLLGSALIGLVGVARRRNDDENALVA